MMRKVVNFAVIFWLCCSMSAVAKTQVTLWHAMAGGLGDVIDEIVTDFNHSQSFYQVKAVYKGDYQETLITTVAAFRAGQHPDLVQVFEVGTATMMYPKGIVLPVHALNSNVRQNDFLPAIKNYYADKTGLMAMPFNSSVALLYYDKSAFKRAGIANTVSLSTWPEVAKVAKRLRQQGEICGITATWPSWTLIENTMARHNVALADQENGRAGLASTLYLNQPLLQKHLSQFSEWQQQGIFHYGGRQADAVALFNSGKCTMIIDSSGMVESYRQLKGQKLGVRALPTWDTPAAGQQVIGGGALWVLQKRHDAHYEGVAAFITYLAQPAVQAKWARRTGYLPVTESAYRLLQQQGYYQTHPGLQTAIDLLRGEQARFAKGTRLGHYMQIRHIIERSLELIWSGQATVEAGLRQAQHECNLVLTQFKRNVQPRSA